MQLPKKISPCPILEAIVEIRFNPNVPPTAVFGIIYNQLKDNYKDYEELPILELPRSLLETDEKLRFQPHYKLFKDNYILQIGSNMISISIKNYTGWTDFKREIDDVVTILSNSKIVDKIYRLGMRYIDFFENEDMFNNINLQISLNSEPFESISKYFSTEMIKDKFKVLLQISNKAEIKTPDLDKKDGSLIDYDLSVDKDLNDFFNNYKDILNDAHKILKENFFLYLLKPEYLTKLNPEY